MGGFIKVASLSLVLFAFESVAAANFSTDFVGVSFLMDPNGFSLDGGRI